MMQNCRRIYPGTKLQVARAHYAISDRIHEHMHASIVNQESRKAGMEEGRGKRKASAYRPGR
jgi:hypothetical protein